MRGELREIESGVHEGGSNRGSSFVLGPAENAAHHGDEQHILPGPLIFIAMDAAEDNSGEHDAGGRSQAANKQRHQESPEGEFLRHGPEDHDQNAEQDFCSGRAEHFFKRKVDFRRAQSRAQQAYRQCEQRPRQQRARRGAESYRPPS